MQLPKTLSASALHVASLCMKRFEAEYVERGRGLSNYAAKTGSACHGALEAYVKAVYINKTEQPGLNLLLGYFQKSYSDVFGNSNFRSPEYLDGEAMLSKWFAEADFTNREVISAEIKANIPITLNNGAITIPLNYICDRIDRLSDGTICIVDYKSNRWNISSGELRTKIQAKVYALIAQIHHPDAPFIKVEYHMLRHGVTAVLFSKRDNLATWHELMSEVTRIVNTTNPEPTLNPECNYCVLKTTCPALRKNIEVDGVFSLSPAELVDLREVLEAQAKGAKAALEEVDSVLGPLLRPEDGTDNTIEGSRFRALVSARSVRSVMSDVILRVAGEEVANDYMPRKKMTLTEFEKMLADERLTPEQRLTLRAEGVAKSSQTPGIKLEKL